MATATTPRPDNWLRAKNIVFAFVAVMFAYVLYHNESFLLDPQHPVWKHYETFKWWLLPHGLVGACALSWCRCSFPIACGHAMQKSIG